MENGILKNSYYTEKLQNHGYYILNATVSGVERITDPATICAKLNANIASADKEGEWTPWTQSDSSFPVFGNTWQDDRYTCKVGEKSFVTLDSAIEYVLRDSATGTVTMIADETISAPITIPMGKSVMILAEGDCTIKRGTLASGRMFFVNGTNTSLTLGTAGGMGDGNSLTFDGAGNDASDAFWGVLKGGIFTMYDGIKIINMARTDTGNAAVIYASDTSVVNMYGGEISGNSIQTVAAMSAAAIYMNGGTLNLTGGKISGNVGTGIGFEGTDTTVNLSGNPVVADNVMSNGVKRNLCLRSAINITGKLQDAAQIGVSFVVPPTGSDQKVFAIGSPYTITENDLKRFASDAKGYAIQKNNNTLEMYVYLKHTLKVNSGIGSGDYSEGDMVTVTADLPPAGKQFDQWTVISGSVVIADRTNPTASFAMPDSDAEITAAYKNATDSVCSLMIKGKTTDYSTLQAALDAVPTDFTPAMITIKKNLTIENEML